MWKKQGMNIVKHVRILNYWRSDNMYEPGDLIYDRDKIVELWNEAIPFHKTLISLFTFFIFPRKSLRLINFAVKMLVLNNIPIK